jgi:hypothetical protein
MENFITLDNNALQLPSGVFAGIESYARYPGGQLEGVKLYERNMLVTHAGELVPFYSETTRRKNKFSVEFYKSGAVKAAALEEQQEIQTPIGEFPAELVTFFETGELKRFFPLDGKISGFWSEEEERALAIPFTFELPFCTFTAIVSGVGFFEDGNIRSITLFPKETVSVRTAYGAVLTRNGFSLHPTGGLATLEPAEPAAIQTPIGRFLAYDPNAIGVNADVNSLAFDTSGNVAGLVTAQNRIAVQTGDGRLLLFRPREQASPTGGDAAVIAGLTVQFAPGIVTVTESGKKPRTISLADCGFTVTETENSCAPSDCAGCSLGCDACGS